MPVGFCSGVDPIVVRPPILVIVSRASPLVHALLCPPYARCRDQLPDGRVIKFGGERFEAPEALFNPYVHRCKMKVTVACCGVTRYWCAISCCLVFRSMIGGEGPGISDMLFDMIQAAPIDLRSEVCDEYRVHALL